MAGDRAGAWQSHAAVDRELAVRNRMGLRRSDHPRVGGDLRLGLAHRGPRTRALRTGAAVLDLNPFHYSRSRRYANMSNTSHTADRRQFLTRGAQLAGGLTALSASAACGKSSPSSSATGKSSGGVA